MTPEVRDVLSSARGRAAVADGRPGEVIRLVRTALGMRQADLGAAVGYSQSAICRIEKGQGRGADMTVLATIAHRLGIPPGALGLAGDRLDIAEPPPTLAGEVDMMRRSTFLRGALGAVAAVALPAVLTRDAPHVGAGDVDAVRGALARLYELDSELGAGHVEALNVSLITRLRGVLATGSYSPVTRRGLQEVLAAASENAGWTAYDAGRHEEARRWWLEALHAADLGEHHAVRTVTFASMSLQAATLRHGAEAVQLAEAAHRDPSATPVVRSILAARLAEAHATNGDRAGAIAAMTLAEQMLAAGPRDDDPPWTSFWGEADLRGHESRAAIALGDFPRAERAAHRAVEVSKSGHIRNHALYSVRLGRILVSRRALDEAIAVITPAVTACRSVRSGRLRSGIGQVAAKMSQHDHAPAREFAAWATKMSA